MSILASITVLYPRWKIYKYSNTNTLSISIPRTSSNNIDNNDNNNSNIININLKNSKDWIKNSSLMDLNLKIIISEPGIYNGWIRYVCAKPEKIDHFDTFARHLVRYVSY